MATGLETFFATIDWSLLDGATHLAKEHRSFRSLAEFLSGSLVWWLISVASLVTFYRKGVRRHWPAVLCLLLAIGVADMVSRRVIKPLVSRARPCYADAVRVHVAEKHCGGFESFPSNHAANSAAFAVAVAFVFRGAIPWVAALLALLIGFSRVALRVHYPTDVLFGFLLGGLGCCGIFAIARARGWLPRDRERILP